MNARLLSAATHRRTAVPWLAGLSMLFTALVAGLAIAVGLGIPAAALAVALTLVIYLAARYGLRTYRFGANGPFWSAILMSVGFSVLGLASPVNLGALMEVWLLCLTPWIVFAGPQGWRRSPLMRVVLVLFGIGFVLLLLSTLLSPHLRAKAAAYQFAYNLKWPLMLLLGFRVCWQDADHARLRLLMWLFVALTIMFLLLDAGAPTAYRAIGRNLTEYHHTSNALLGGVVDRMTGPFVHSSVLAYFASFFLALVVVQRLTGLIKTVPALLLAGPLFALVVLSGQKQEFATVIVACAAVAVAMRVRSVWTVLALFTVAPAVLAVLYIAIFGMPPLGSLGEEWGLVSGVSAVISARPVLTGDAVGLANAHWPLGSGLGTFASVGAKLYNRDIYETLGYFRFWWYRNDQFLLDTYWPNFIAEGGWISALALFMIPVMTSLYSLRKVSQASDPLLKTVWAYAFCGQFLPFGVSLTSPIFGDVNVAAFGMMMLGMAHLYEQRAVASATPKPAVPGVREHAGLGRQHADSARGLPGLST
jgi:hypothetical protein